MAIYENLGFPNPLFRNLWGSVRLWFGGGTAHAVLPFRLRFRQFLWGGGLFCVLPEMDGAGFG